MKKIKKIKKRENKKRRIRIRILRKHQEAKLLQLTTLLIKILSVEKLIFSANLGLYQSISKVRRRSRRGVDLYEDRSYQGNHKRRRAAVTYLWIATNRFQIKIH